MLRRGILIAVVGLMVAACGTASSDDDSRTNPPPNTDPKKGLVLVIDNEYKSDDIYKQCDLGGGAAVMVYMRYYSESGISTVRDHPECQ